MPQNRATEIALGDGTTVVVVIPPTAADASGSLIARALERAAQTLRSGERLPGFDGEFGGEAALMRRVEAEVYGTS